MIGVLIIFIFPFLFYYLQINHLNQKINSINKAMQEKKETYFDPIDICTRWTKTGEKVFNTTWHYCKTHPEQDAVEGDYVLIGTDTYQVYKNYSKEQFFKHVQWQINHNKCWCYERRAYNDKTKGNFDYKLKYNIKEKYFYYLTFDYKNHSYCIIYYGNNKKEPISYNRYQELGGYEQQDRSRRY